MVNFDDVTKENIKQYSPSWSQILDHSYRILTIGGSGSRTINALLNLISHKLHTDKIYLYSKNAYEAKYQFVINIREGVGSKHWNNSKAFIKYSNDIYQNIEEYNPNIEHKYWSFLMICLLIWLVTKSLIE